VHDGLWYVLVSLPLLALAAFALWSKRSTRDPFVWGCVAWIVAGAVAVLMQRQSWWAYQMLLFSVPVGVLATIGLDSIRRWKPAFIIVAIVCALPFVVKYGAAAALLARHGFALGRDRAITYREAVSPLYAGIRADTRFLRDGTSLPGDIFVFGNPLYYLTSARGQAVALSGWSPELYLPEQWVELNEELRAARPPYLFVGSEYAQLIRERDPQLVQVLGREYHMLTETPRGIWYGSRATAMIHDARNAAERIPRSDPSKRRLHRLSRFAAAPSAPRGGLGARSLRARRTCTSSSCANRDAEG
jgi:hypothetical protein